MNYESLLCPTISIVPKYRSYRKEAKKFPSGQNRKRFLQGQVSFFLTNSTLSTAHRLFSGMIFFILNFFLFLEKESSIGVSLICIVVGNCSCLWKDPVPPVPEQTTPLVYHSGTVQVREYGIQQRMCGRKLLDTGFSMLTNIHSLIVF